MRATIWGSSQAMFGLARLLKCSGWLPEVLRRADLLPLDGEAIVEGQGDDAVQSQEVALPAFLAAGLPDSAASKMAAE